MKPSRKTALISTLLLTLLLGTAAAHAAAGSSMGWSEILGLLQKDAQGEVLGDPWFVKDGQALVNVQTGHIRFDVKQLPLAAGPSEIEFETPQVATLVKGTLVCNASAGAGATLVHTPAVPVTSQGEATFAGQVPLPTACAAAPHDLAFFLRTVAGSPSQE